MLLRWSMKIKLKVCYRWC